MKKKMSDQEKKNELWKIHDRIMLLKDQEKLIGLSDREDLELRNLEVKFNNEYHALKESY
ncbi:hypothetical protein ACVVIH_20605 [Chryseobacterium arthrosphaerae]|uniref:hypothetical protein n=1 Tax=Chryseobacterium arthrosphaerae TaxID=651561 RepID=UPI003D32CDE9